MKPDYGFCIEGREERSIGAEEVGARRRGFRNERRRFEKMFRAHKNVGKEKSV